MCRLSRNWINVLCAFRHRKNWISTIFGQKNCSFYVIWWTIGKYRIPLFIGKILRWHFTIYIETKCDWHHQIYPFISFPNNFFGSIYIFARPIVIHNVCVCVFALYWYQLKTRNWFQCFTPPRRPIEKLCLVYVQYLVFLYRTNALLINNDIYTELPVIFHFLLNNFRPFRFHSNIDSMDVYGLIFAIRCMSLFDVIGERQNKNIIYKRWKRLFHSSFRFLALGFTIYILLSI